MSSISIEPKCHRSARHPSSFNQHRLASESRSHWILGPSQDMLLVIGSPLLVYIVITIARLRWSAEAVSSLVMVWAIGHQLPSLMRAYGDPELFSRFRARFLLSPLLLLLTCCSSFLYGLNGVFLLAGGWGLWHLMMQTYGFVRIYDSKVGVFDGRTRMLDQAMCFTWFAAAVTLNDNALFRFVSMFHNCGVATGSPEFLLGIKYVIATATLLVTVAFIANWCHSLKVGIRPNPVKLLLMVSTFTCFWYSTATVANLVIAYAYFELFHDIQYLTIVWIFNRNRVEKDQSLRGFTRFLFRPRVGLILLYLSLVSSYGMLDFGSKLMSSGTPQRLLFGCFLATALLHYYFDGFIWKLRDATTQSNLEIEKTFSSRISCGLLRRPGHRLMWGLLMFAFAGLTFAELSKRVDEGNETSSAMRKRIAIETQTWVEAMPNSFRAQFYAGLAHEQQGEYTAARRRYKRALAILPGYTAAITRLESISTPELLPVATAHATD